MWEDFMRGNWPAIAPAVPAPRTALEAVELATLREHQPGGAPFLTSPVYALSAPAQATHAAASHTAPAHARTAHPGSRKFAVRTVVTAGAGLLLAVVLPGSAVASAVHTVSHGAHAAVISRP
jgi:hypothetical protein